MIFEFCIQPFIEHDYMRRALAALLALSLGCGPIGVFLMLRRMSLMGDAMSHAILPGVAVAVIFFGTALWPMTIGGFVVALVVALAAGFISRSTALNEDTSFAAIYLISLAAGVMIVSLHGNSEELEHILFGDVFAINKESLLMVAAIATLTVISLATIYRPLIAECFDPVFLRSVRGRGGLCYMVFLVLVALNLVAGFQALGTLMTLGLIIIPAASTNFWSQTIDRCLLLSMAFAIISGMAGLLIAYHLEVPSGASIVLVAGGLYALCLLIGSHNSLRAKLIKHRHLKI